MENVHHFKSGLNIPLSLSNAPVPPKDLAPILSGTLNRGQSVEKKTKMGGNTGSVLKPRLSPSVLRPPQDSSVFPRPGSPIIVLQSCWIFWVYICKICDLITIAFLGTQQDATF